MQEESKYISLSAFSERIRIAIEGYTGGEQWVVAEVSNIQVNYSGHCYLELTERSEGQQMPRAVCRAVIWGNRFKIISSYFRHETGSDIVQGMKILVKCSASYHAVYGLSLVIGDIDPTFTLGEVERVKQQTIARLRKEGVFEMNKELELPEVIQRVAVISSSTAAGYGDFMNELERSPFRFDVTLFQAVMQGEGAENSIIEALERVAEDEFDAVIIIRGGGSASDLACFDTYALCANIAQFPMPVITGIGHDRDVSVADMVACLSLKTPTAVAGHMIDLASEFWTRLEKAEQFIINNSQQTLINESRRVENASLYLQQIVKQSIHRNFLNINTLESELKFVGNMFFKQNQAKLDSIREWIVIGANTKIAKETETYKSLTEQLRTAVTTIISNENHRLEMTSLSVEAANPRRILRMGYAIVNNGLRSLNQINIGDDLTVELADGTIKAKVNEKWQKNS